MIAFIIWLLMGCVFIGFGLAAFFSKNPSGFWANAEVYEIEDVKGYNSAMGKLWCIGGVIFIVIGIPLITGQNSPFILLSILGALVWTISLMVVYELVICKKYRKNL